MPFAPRIVEARLALKLIRPEDFPSLAMDALEAGIDGPITRRLAGLIRPSGYEADMYVERFMAEAGLQHIPIDVAAARLAQELAREVLSTGEDPLRVTRELEHLWITADYSGSIQDLGTLDDEVNAFYEGRSLEASVMVRERLQAFAELPDVP